ncbi:MAG: hypothetical protein GX998_10755 [Firmicutes bacterium]|nr:hypothetical protein [Bacillota bacterium]
MPRGRLVCAGLCILLIGGASLILVPVVKADSFIGIYNGTPLIHFGLVDPARPPVVITGGTQMLVVAPQDPWALTIEAKGDLVNIEQPQIQIPASRLAWAVNDGNQPRWTPLQANTPQTVLDASIPTEDAGEIVRIDYRFCPSWADPPLPQQYATELCFTLSPDLDPKQSWVYPTPFWPDGTEVLTIGYWLPGIGLQQVEVTITDAEGGLVRKMRTNQLGGQWYEVFWDGLTGAGEIILPGIYYYEVIVLSREERIAAGIIEVANSPRSGQGTLCGRVTGADTGEGLVGAQVALYTRERRHTANRPTGGDGTYRLTLLPAGEYYLEASMPGYVAATTDIFYLDGHEECQLDLQLFPNRALDIDLQLSSRTVSMGDLLMAAVQITNSGTRDLEEVIGEMTVPAGFAYVGSQGETGRIYTRQAGSDSGGRIAWEVGPLGEGASAQAELWFLVGLDAAGRDSHIRARAIGHGAWGTVETEAVSKMVEVTAGPFIATSPRNLVDSHFVVPIGSDVSIEVEIEPHPAVAEPSIPFQDMQLERHIDRNPLVPVAEPLMLAGDWLHSHRLRFRLEGSEWAVEGGSWEHDSPQQQLSVGKFPIAGLQGATRFGPLVVRGFYGIPRMWPVFSLYPADNTSGPFALPKPLPLHGSVKAEIVSWDPIRGVWREEPSVLFRVDYAQGALTLGRAVGAHNSRGERQYILITYVGGTDTKGLGWKEAAVSMTHPGWGVVVNYLETGVNGQIRLMGMRGQITNDRWRLHGSLQTAVGDKASPWFDVTAALRPDCQTTDASALSSRSAGKLVVALEIHPGMRLGGGWGHEGVMHSGSWGITSEDIRTARADQPLDKLAFKIREQLTGMSPRTRQGVGPLAVVGKQSQTRAIAAEVDLVGGWMASFMARKEELSRQGNEMESKQGDSIQRWEQRLNYQAVGLPHWSLGYGQQVAHYSADENKSHYGLLEVEGELPNLEWGAQLALTQNLTGEVMNKAGQPIKAVAGFSARYGKGKLRPYVNGRQGSSPVLAGNRTPSSFEEWTVGIESDVTENLEVSVAHSNKRASDGTIRVAGSREQSYTTSRSETLSLAARYAFLEKWSVRGSGEWVTNSGGGWDKPQWRGSIELEGKLDGGILLELGWARSQRLGALRAGQWVDQLQLDVQQLPYRAGSEAKLVVGTSLVEGNLEGWEVISETVLELNNLWEAWARATVKAVNNNLTGTLITQQGIIRLSRRLSPRLAGFVQIGGWQQIDKAELGYSLGLSYQIVPGLNWITGYTWPINHGHPGFLSVKPGVFVQLFAH